MVESSSKAVEFSFLVWQRSAEHFCNNVVQIDDSSRNALLSINVNKEEFPS
jgi:hypothetical protein